MTESKEPYPGFTSSFPLFKHLQDEHGLTLVESELYEILALGAQAYRNTLSQALRDVIDERHRQIDSENFTPEHDDSEHDAGELAGAGATYAINAASELHPYTGYGIEADSADDLPECWLLDFDWWKPKGPARDLIRAAALIVAERERFDREQIKRPG